MIADRYTTLADSKGRVYRRTVRPNEITAAELFTLGLKGSPGCATPRFPALEQSIAYYGNVQWIVAFANADDELESRTFAGGPRPDLIVAATASEMVPEAYPEWKWLTLSVTSTDAQVALREMHIARWTILGSPGDVWGTFCPTATVAALLPVDPAIKVLVEMDPGSPKDGVDPLVKVEFTVPDPIPPLP